MALATRYPFPSLMQKMKSKTATYYFLFITTLLLYSCSFNKAKYSTGVDFLQGKWNEDSVMNKESLVSYQQYQFSFSCDSFYLKVETLSKVNLEGGSCFNKKHWNEFAKGNYRISKDTLKFEGNFVSEEYKYKPEGSCYRSGKYLEDFILNSDNENIVILKSLQTGLYHQLILKQRGSCSLKDDKN